MIPEQLIQHLLEKWKYDHATLLSDESQDDFNSYFISSDSKYSQNSIYGAPNSVHPDSYFPEPIHIPKPAYPAFYPSGNSYIPPRTHNHSHFTGYPDRRPSPPFFEPHIANQLLSYKISKNPYVHSQYSGLQNTYKLLGQPQIIQYHQDDWWKRYCIVSVLK
ncbi:gpi transamidase component pig-t-related [Holotrichia oblita]|uniref:Gpi transamidase component pig-t-related n=1 Tax=Holotrichia oblita TaxID=644536 RepID=A0ACB9TDF2_HOLOL|nr:gpi transamidase component pig-t-related [Holotrichia oblita]